MKKLFYSLAAVIATLYLSCWLIDGSPPSAEKCAEKLIPLIEMAMNFVRPVWTAFWSFLGELIHFVFSKL